MQRLERAVDVHVPLGRGLWGLTTTAPVTPGEEITVVLAIFDLSDSYSGTFPMFTVAALIGVVLILLARRPARAVLKTAAE